MRESIVEHFHPEYGIDTFTIHDGTVMFYLFVNALCKTAPKKILDFGAGRAAWMDGETSHTKSNLRDLRRSGAHVTAVDVDEAVLANRASHEQVLVREGEVLPFADGEFDMIICDHVLEHIANPAVVADELQRVLRHGGWICARTPNVYGYVSVASQTIPNALHRGIIRIVQPNRESHDVFPTYYRLNSVAAIRKHFSQCESRWYRNSGEPAYHMNSRMVYRILLGVHKILPNIMLYRDGYDLTLSTPGGG